MAFDIGTIEGKVKLTYDGSAFDKLDKDMRKAKRGVTSTIDVNEKLDRSTRKTSGSMGAMGGAAAGLGSKMGGALKAGAVGAALAIGTGLTVALKDAYTESREAAKITRLTANAIKASGGAANVTAKQVGDLANKLSEKTAIDDEAIQSSANLLLTFRNIRNEAGKNNDIFNQATETALDMAQAYGVDLPSATKMLGKAMQDPGNAASALKRTGAIDEAGVQRLKKMAEDGVSVLQMQKVLLEEINKAGVKGAAGAAADPIQKLQVAYKNLMETVGLALLPHIQKAAGALSRFINQMRTGKGTGGEFAKMIKMAWENFKELWPIIKYAGQAIGFVINNFKKLPGPVKSLLMPFGGLVMAMRAVIAVAKWLVAAFKNTINWITNAWSNVIGFFKRLPRRIGSALSGLGRIVMAPFKWAADRIKGTLDKIIDWFKGAVKKLKGIPGSVWGDVKGGISSVVPGLSQGARVGPNSGGARLFVAGEGSKDEWVVSQEGSRGMNQDLVTEAAQALGGVAFFRKGGRPGNPKRISQRIDNMRSDMDLKRRAFELSGGMITRSEFDRLIVMNKAIERELLRLIRSSKGQAKKDARFALRTAQLDRQDLIKERDSALSEAVADTPGLDSQIADLQLQLELAAGGYGGDAEAIRSQLKGKLEAKLASLRDRLSKTKDKEQVSLLQQAIMNTLSDLSGLGGAGGAAGGPSIIEQTATAASLRFSALAGFGSNAMQMGLGSGGMTLAKQGGTTVVLNGEFKLNSDDPHQGVRQLGHQIAQNL